MTDFLFTFADEYCYSNNLSNWKDLTAGSKIIIFNDPNEYSVVKNDIIQYNKKFIVKDKNTISISENTKDIVLDGDALACEFDFYNLIILNDLINKGAGYKIGDLLKIEENAFFNKSYDKKEGAEFLIKSVDSNGSILELELKNEGKFLSTVNEGNLIGGSGQGAIGSFIFRKSKEKIKLLFSVIDCVYQEKQIDVKIEEEIPPNFKQGEFSLSRHRVTINKKINKIYSYQPFFLVEEETPYLKLPLAKSNNIQNLYNQAILTIDHKLKELSNKIKA